MKDFEWAIGLNRLCLKTIGVWPNSAENDKKNLRLALAIASMILCLFLPQMYALSIVFNDLLLVIDNLLTSVPALTSATKLLLLWRAQTTLQPVIRIIATDWSESKDDWERKIMQKMANRGRTLTICGMAVMALTFFGTIVAPFFGISYRVITNLTDHGDRHLLVQAYHPYDATKSPYFELSYLAEAIGLGLVSVCFTVPANFFTVLVLHAAGQIQILAVKITNLEPLSSRELFSSYLKEIVDKHVHIIRMVNDIEKAFNLLVFAQLVALSVMICCLGFQFLNAMSTSKTSEQPPLTQLFILGIALFGMILHTFIYCLAGEVLTYESAKIKFSAFSCKWYTFPRKNVKNLLPIMMRSNEPLRLTAGSFLQLSLESFCQILKTSAGYMSMLIAVKDK